MDLGSILDGLRSTLIVQVGNVVQVGTASTRVLQHFTDDRGNFDDEITAAERDGNQQREETWALRDQLTPHTSALEYSDHAIVEDDPFDAMSHTQIYEHVNQMDPAVLDAVSSSWNAISSRVADGIEAFNSAVSAAVGEGWQGQGGSAALEAVLAYASNGRELETRVELVANKVDEAQIALGQAKRSIPAPDGASFAEQVISLVPGASWRQAQYEAEEAERLARQVMKETYLPFMKRADDQVPILLPAFNPVTSGAGSGGGPSGGGSSGSGSGGSGSGGSPFPAGADLTANSEWAGGSGDSSARTGVAPNTAETLDAGAVGGSGGVGSGSDPATFGVDRQGSSAAPGLGGSDPASTSAASSLPQPFAGTAGTGIGLGSAPGTGSGLGAGSGVGSGAGVGFGGVGRLGGGASSGGIGVGGLASGGITGGGLAGSGLGAGARSGVAGGMSGIGGRTATGGGMGAMGGGMAGGRGQSGSDDATHETPGYLVNIDNGNELIGDLPMVTPPVLGQ